MLCACSTGTGNPEDQFRRVTGTGGAPAQTQAIDGDAAAEAPAELCVNPSPVNKPYRGVNLTGMAMRAYGEDVGYTESDFSTLHDLGFNWVRLPIDYLASIWSMNRRMCQGHTTRPALTKVRILT
jgi:aryl-phospho-beta-D-glucosidase BglC (GH1 family)